MLSLFKKYKQKKEFLAIMLVLSLMVVGIFALNFNLSEKTGSGASSHSFELTPTPATGFPTSLALDLDADAEGGLLGAEVNIAYDPNIVTVSSISLGSCPFAANGSCIDLSQPGLIKLLGVSGQGNPVEGSSTFATINVSMSEAAIFSFSKCQVIDQNNTLKSCGSLPLSVGSTCGDGNVEGAEQCDDGNVVDGDGCSSACLVESTCGDDTAEGSEACDGTDLKDQACTDLGFESGTLSCAGSCTFDTSECVAAPEPPAEECGDGNVDEGEECDGDNLNSQACTDQGFDSGTLSCAGDCTFDTSACEGAPEPFCGDGNVDEGELCDGENLGSESCASQNSEGIGLSCANDCTFDTSTCAPDPSAEPQCGNGIIDGGDECDDGNNIDDDGCSAACLDEAPPEPTTPTLTSLTIYSGDADNTIQVGEWIDLSVKAEYDIGDPTYPSASNVSYKLTSGHSYATLSGARVTAIAEGSVGIEASFTHEGITKPSGFTLTVTPLPAVCGNGDVEGAETCDDGNTDTETCDYGETDCTVCDSSCQQIAGAVTGYCSDGAVNGPEECDDGNELDDDGCSATCVVEIAPEPVVEEPSGSSAPDEVIEEPVIDEPVHSSARRSGDIIETETTEELQEALQPTSFANQEVVEQQAVQAAVAVVETTEVIEEAATVIAAPVTQQEVLTRIDLCKLNPEYAGANFDDRSADTDGDGLTDRTECYAETNPLVTDSDNDGFSDGDEVNLLNSNPTVIDAPKPILEVMLISDPQPGWILGDNTPRVAGMAPMTATTVTVTALHADQKLINQLEDQLSNLASSEAEEEFNSQLLETVESAHTFTVENGDFFDYSEFTNILEALQSINFESKAELAELADQLNSLKREPIVLGSTDAFSETFLGEDIVKRFEFESSNELEDKKLYDLVATATLNGKSLSSSAVRLGINSGLTINKPTPRSLGEVPILASMALGNMRINNANAQNGFIDIEIEDERPTISGDSEFGSQVYAIWNSLVLASSVISDSEEGAFSLQAPQNLETGVPHRVTLYAVKTDAENTLRSESVDVYFNITPPAAAGLGRMATIYMLLAALGLLIIASLVHYFRSRGAHKPIVGEEESHKSATDSGHVFEHFFKKFPEGLRSAAPEGPMAPEVPTPEAPTQPTVEPLEAPKAPVEPVVEPLETPDTQEAPKPKPVEPAPEVSPEPEAAPKPDAPAEPETAPKSDSTDGKSINDIVTDYVHETSGEPEVKPEVEPEETKNVQSLGTVFDQLPAQPKAEAMPSVKTPEAPMEQPTTAEPSADQSKLDLETSKEDSADQQ